MKRVAVYTHDRTNEFSYVIDFGFRSRGYATESELKPMTIYADAAQHISHSTLVIDNNNNNNVDVDQVVEIGENKAHFCLPLAL